jgi:cysteine desulfurase
MIYLDNNATTSVSHEVLTAMLPFLAQEFGNPSSKYYRLATTAQTAVEKARAQVAALVYGTPDEIIFTSGATESNNLVIKGVADYYVDKGRHLITSMVEHKSVLEAFHYLAERGYEITILPTDKYGRVQPDKLEKAIRPDTILISIMWGNNETGTLNDVETLAQICETRQVFFHTDATQVVGKLPMNLSRLRAHFLSLSAHKFHGPKGIGACYIRKDKNGLRTKLTPLIHGGNQEQGYRAGTLAVHNIVGLGKAAEIALRDMNENRNFLQAAEEWLFNELKKIVPGIRLNGHPTERIPGVLNIIIPGLNNELLIQWLAQQDIAVSSGSACSVSEPSYVLQTMGLSLEQVRQSIRISLDPSVQTDDLRRFCQCIRQALS